MGMEFPVAIGKQEITLQCMSERHIPYLLGETEECDHWASKACFCEWLHVSNDSLE